MVPVISFVGRHNSGKTTLLSEIVALLEQRGIKTAVVKHAASGIDLSGENDSERLFLSGARLVYAITNDLSVVYRREQEINLESICKQVGTEVDIIISEGFKKESFPKIEVLREAVSPVILELDNVIARVADFPLEGDVPLFTFHQKEEIINFILDYFDLPKREDR